MQLTNSRRCHESPARSPMSLKDDYIVVCETDAIGDFRRFSRPFSVDRAMSLMTASELTRHGAIVLVYPRKFLGEKGDRANTAD